MSDDGRVEEEWETWRRRERERDFIKERFIFEMKRADRAEPKSMKRKRRKGDGKKDFVREKIFCKTS